MLYATSLSDFRSRQYDISERDMYEKSYKSLSDAQRPYNHNKIRHVGTRNDANEPNNSKLDKESNKE